MRFDRPKEAHKPVSQIPPEQHHEGQLIQMPVLGNSQKKTPLERPASSALLPVSPPCIPLLRALCGKLILKWAGPLMKRSEMAHGSSKDPQPGTSCPGSVSQLKPRASSNSSPPTTAVNPGWLGPSHPFLLHCSSVIKCNWEAWKAGLICVSHTWSSALSHNQAREEPPITLPSFSLRGTTPATSQQEVYAWLRSLPPKVPERPKIIAMNISASACC